MRRSLRLRTLFLLCGMAAAALAAAVAYSVGPVAVEAALGDAVPPDQLRAAAEALRGAILVAALASLLLVVPVSLWIGDFARRPIAELRAAFGPGGGTPPGSWISEVDALAAALARLLDEHRRELAPLIRERDELAYLIDSVGEGILQVGPDGRFVRANHTAREMLGLPERVARQPVSTLVRNGELRELLDAARSGGTVEPAELSLDERRILVAAHPLGGAEQRPGAVAVLVDLTHLRRLESVRRDFVANATHELRTPLTAIRGFAETLRDGALDDRPTALRFLTAIHRHALRLQRLAEDLTTLAQAESLQHSFDTVSTDLRAMVRESAGSLEGAAHAKAIELVFELPAEKVVLDVSPRALDHALINLIENAIKYSPEGSTVTIRLQSREDQVTIDVQDQGPGIAPEVKERIFERFFRVEGGRSPQEAGTGLGLSIARNMVERVGGELSLETEVGKGSTFRIVLPREEDDDDDD